MEGEGGGGEGWWRAHYILSSVLVVIVDVTTVGKLEIRNVCICNCNVV